MLRVTPWGWEGDFGNGGVILLSARPVHQISGTSIHRAAVRLGPLVTPLFSTSSEEDTTVREANPGTPPQFGEVRVLDHSSAARFNSRLSQSQSRPSGSYRVLPLTLVQTTFTATAGTKVYSHKRLTQAHPSCISIALLENIGRSRETERIPLPRSETTTAEYHGWCIAGA
ncbi:hypothetical protein FB45DRAFT_861039 [Roridomyces roridus]|uniref:Uncharacterized protein n=1 Tax=Roridomyces roridus TaxID=1738132 RepID=A0AAD7CGU7_9AGAR|nr:hypothetical protein FB45DRAFT_861039 [Roridomyces roridus]